MLLMLLAAALAQAPELPEERPILAEIQVYDEQIAALDSQLAALDQQAGEREAARAAQAVAVERARAGLDQDRSTVRVLVRAYYSLARRGIARLFFDAESPVELRRRVAYLGAILREHQDRTVAFARLATARAEAEGKLEAESKALAALRAELDQRRGQLEAERVRRVDLLRAVRGSRDLAMRANLEQRVVQGELTRSVELREATAPAATTAEPTAAFRAARGRLPRPVEGSVIHAFGAYVDPTTGEEIPNLGLDLAAPPGTPFRAVFAGEVTRSGYVRGYGQVVMVQHGSYTTLYAHANGLKVAAGETVRQGDVLGLVGTTGLVADDRARLHFEIRYNGTPQDPAAWLGS